MPQHQFGKAQGALLKAEVIEEALPGFPTQVVAKARISQDPSHSLDPGLRIAFLDEEAFAPIPHGRLNGRHARSDNNASGRHVLDEL